MTLPLEAPAAPQAAPLPDFEALHRRFPALGRFREQLGATTLREVPGPAGGARILAKCEWENPVGSVKDRVAYALVCAALERHGDRPLGDLRILEYSGGNLARALAHVGSLLGLAMRFVVPSVTPPSLLADLRERGFAVTLVDREEGFLGTVRAAVALAEAEPEWTLLYQHRNDANRAFHAATTGAELVAQLAGATPAAWVASIGTGGTLMGVRGPLAALNPALRTVGVTPAELPYGSPLPPNGLPKYTGATGLGHGIRQPFVRPFDEVVEHRCVPHGDALRGMARFLDETGLRIGSSASANWLAAREVARELPGDALVLTVLPDAGSPEDWQLVRSLDADGPYQAVS